MIDDKIDGKIYILRIGNVGENQKIKVGDVCIIEPELGPRSDKKILNIIIT